MSSGSGPIRVMIVDDDLFVRDHLADFLASAPDFALVGTCADGVQAVALAGRESPDVVLMDVQMPVMGGIEATREISRVDPSVRIIALTSFADDTAVAEMLDAGAAGFLLKSTKAHVLLDAIRAANHGLTVVPPDTVRRWGSSALPRPVGPTLTERERQVLDLLAEGLNNRQIAQAMFLSTSTVKTHLRELMRKLDTPSRIGVVRRADDLGLLADPEGR